MPAHAPTVAAAALPPLDVATSVRRLAARAWIEMDAAGVLPTPRHFGLWYTHLSGTHPDLSHRLAALLARGTPPDAALQALHDGCMAHDPGLDAIADNADAIQQAAQAVVDQVAGNADALRAYGDALAQVAGEIGEVRTVDALVRAVTTLSAETARAGERNRVLEQQLSASAARIGKLRQSLAEVRQEATTDALTGLLNRRAFDLRLRKAVSRAGTEDGPLALLLLDVDNFKHFNDSFGHKAGDLVLRLVGRMLADNVKGRDTAARYGGEEFAVILTGADLRAGVTVAEQMRAALDGRRLVNQRTHFGEAQPATSVTASFGVAQLRPGEAAADLVARADAALYRAKHGGRNRVCADLAVA